MASEGDTYGTITLKGTPITELRVTDIKRELEKRGLSKSGSKTQLSDRLKAQLLLEKLQQDAAQSSGDEHEGKVPNMALQQDDKAGQSEFVRQYLQQQQRNLEIQMEMKKQVEEERKRKSADESSADESKNAVGSQAENPDMTSAKQFKDDTSNAPAKEGAKMSKPARKSGRNSSKGNNGQEVEHVKERSESPVSVGRDRTRSGSSSSSGSPSSEKYSGSRRGRSSRGKAKRGGVRRGEQRNRSRSSSSSTSPEVTSKKMQRNRNNSSSQSGSRSPQIVSPEAPTRRSSRRSSTTIRVAPDHVQEKELSQDGSGDKSVEKSENADEHLPSAPKRRWRKKPSSETKTNELDQNKVEPIKSTSVTSALHRVDSTNEQKELGQLTITSEKSNVEKVVAKGQIESNKSREMECSETSRQTMVTGEGAEFDSSSKDIAEAIKVEENLSGDSGRSSLSKVMVHEIITGTVSSTTSSSNQPQNTVTKNVKGNELSSVKGDNAKGLITLDQTSIAGKKELFSETVELDKKKLVSEGKAKEEFDCLPQMREEKVRTSGLEQIDSPVKSENKGQHSPSRKTQRNRSYSSDSSSVESRSRSKSPRKKRSRSGSSSSSNSHSRSSSSNSSTDDSGINKSKVINEIQAHGKDEHSRLSSHSPERVVHDREKIDGNKKDVAVSRNIDHGKDAKTLLPTTTLSSTQKPRSQEEKRKQPGKEQECRSDETKGQQEILQTDQDASRDSVSNADGDEETIAKKGVKKRKWGSKTSKAGKTTKRTSSLEISSDVLKNLIGDVKLTETVFEMETEMVNTLDYDENEEDRRDVKVKRNVTQDVIQSPPEEEAKTEQEDARRVEAREESSPEPTEILSEPEKKIIKLSNAAPKAGVKTKLKEGKKKKEEKKKGSSAVKENKEDVLNDKDIKEKVFATTRPSKPLLPVVDEPEPVSSSQSPARNPPDRVIRIAGLVRPFTVGQLKELLRRSGELDDEYFWISAIKSHCLAAYKTQEDAVAARSALHGTRWPQSNPKILIVDFATVEDVMHRKAEGDVPLPALIKKAPQEDQKKLKEQKFDEEKEKKPKVKEQKEKGRVEKDKVDRDKRDTREQKREVEKKNPVREWDRDKIQQLSRSRSKSKERERERANRRSRSKDREQRKRRDQSKEKKVEDRKREKKLKDTKAEEEPPAKLLDDLFRKTKATPCIYWLPLTEEQAQQRIAKKLEQEKERQKRVAAAEEREKEELKKREAARLERQREREKARNKSREREREKGRQERSRSYSRSRSRRRR